ncbi:TPA: hypothetical protein ACV5EY_001348, partial [Klebsiella aerogenes]|nr:hypothetical protein [Klebsiella aerogenes]
LMPRLRHCTLIDDIENDKTTIVVGKEYFSIERLAGGRDDFLIIKSLMDGRHTVKQISSLSGIDLSNVIDVVEMFDSNGLLQQRNASDTISCDEFLMKIEDTTCMWRRQIGLHNLFHGLLLKKYRVEVFLGLLIETFHYMKLLPSMLSRVAVYINDEEHKELILKYANEEMFHYLPCLKALSKIERIGDSVKDSHPTMGTLSLIRNFESIAIKNSLSLICCIQFVEARVSEMESAEKNLRAIANVYGLLDAVEPYISHMKYDINMEHSNLLSQSLSSRKSLSMADVHHCINDMHDIKHCFDLFHDDVIKYYGDISNYIPRLSVDYFSL